MPNKPIICTRPNLQLLILNLPGHLCSKRQKEGFLLRCWRER